MIKAILIDIDNTLLDFSRCAEYATKHAFEEWNIKYKPSYLKKFFEINDKYWKLFEDGEITREELYDNRWQDILSQLGIDIDGRAFEKTYLKYMYKSHELIDGAKELIEYLASKYDLYVASNSFYEEQRERLKAAGLFDYFKGLYTSEVVGFPKPSQEYFSYIKEQIGPIEDNEIMIIGDSLRADIKGGKEYGLKTCWFNYDKDETDSNLADYKVDKLLEIKDIL